MHSSSSYGASSPNALPCAKLLAFLATRSPAFSVFIPLLVSSEGTQVAALSGALEASYPARAGRRSRDLNRGLYAPCGVAPRQVSQSAGFEGAAWGRWGSFSVYGVKLHLLCAINRVPLSYELTPANVSEIGLTEELLAEVDLGEEIARELFADLAYRRATRRRSGRVRHPAGHRAFKRRMGGGSSSRLLWRASRGSFVSARPWPPRS